MDQKETKAKRLIGLTVIASPSDPGIGVGPLVPFPATEAERTFAADEAGRAALLLRRPSTAQGALFRHLAMNSSEGSYVVTSAKWIETVLKATKGISDEEMRSLYDFDWTERAILPEELRRQLLARLRGA